MTQPGLQPAALIALFVCSYFDTAIVKSKNGYIFGN
jgi:hypothetical protein